MGSPASSGSSSGGGGDPILMGLMRPGKEDPKQGMMRMGNMFANQAGLSGPYGTVGGGSTKGKPQQSTLRAPTPAPQPVYENTSGPMPWALK